MLHCLLPLWQHKYHSSSRSFAGINAQGPVEEVHADAGEEMYEAAQESFVAHEPDSLPPHTSQAVEPVPESDEETGCQPASVEDTPCDRCAAAVRLSSVFGSQQCLA